jgi:hypothetical protein
LAAEWDRLFVRRRGPKSDHSREAVRRHGYDTEYVLRDFSSLFQDRSNSPAVRRFFSKIRFAV